MLTTTKKSLMQDMEALYSDQAQYLSIGDTILIGYKHKIYYDEIEDFEQE